LSTRLIDRSNQEVGMTDPSTAAVVIVGGGVMGTATAYQLARSGVRDVVLLEAGELASGSSGKPLGGVRAQFSDPTNVELGARSLAAFRRFGEEVGGDIGLREVGYLFALRDPADVAPFEVSLDVQRGLGVDSCRMVDPQEARTLCPYLDADQLVAAVWAPEAGFARPTAVVTGYAAAAAALGVTVRTRTAVTGIESAAGGTAVVRCGDQAIRAAAVICTAGAWSGRVAALAGVDLPIEPVRRQIAFSPGLSGALRPDPALPFTIDYTSTAYFHPAGDDRLLLGWADQDEPRGFDRTVDDGWHAGLREALRQFAPDLADVSLADGWAGFYETTPDHNAVIGEADPGFRFLYAAGFSGHGFLQGPAVGECVSALYRGQTPPVDVSSFDAGRFRGAATRTELGII
jgi:sarcosine oxidase, subunit beta